MVRGHSFGMTASGLSIWDYCVLSNLGNSRVRPRVRCRFVRWRRAVIVLADLRSSRSSMYAIDIYAEVRHAILVERRSMRETARLLGIDRKTVRKIMDHDAPPGYQRVSAPRRPKLGPHVRAIDRMLKNDTSKPPAERRTARQIFEYLVEKRGFSGGLTTVKDYVRARQRQA